MHTVLDIGNCSPDHAALRSLIEGSFDARVVQAHGAADALQILGQQEVALITVNRKLDRDYSDGMEIIRQLKSDPKYQAIPVMLITNFPEHQDAAVAIGAERGFGKLQLRAAETKQSLAAHLS